MAEQVAEIFTEVIVAPAYEDGAVEVLARKKNIRVLRCPDGPGRRRRVPADRAAARCSRSRTALQAEGDDPANWTLATGEALPTSELAELAFAWRACRAVKSNAILLAKDGATVGVGMGQVNRVDSAQAGGERAGAERAAGSYAASDAFFPFPDGLEMLADAGVKAVVAAGRFGPRRAGRRGREEGRRDDVLHRHAALLPLSPPDGAGPGRAGTPA